MRDKLFLNATKACDVFRKIKKKPAFVIFIISILNLWPFPCIGYDERVKSEPQILARVDDAILTMEEFNRLIEKLPGKEKEGLTLRVKKRTVEEWILDQLFAKEAETRGLDEKEDIRKKLKEARTNILSRELLKDELDKLVITQEELKGYYEANRERYLLPEEVRIRQILVTSRSEAEDILRELKGGARFEELAKERSTDPAAKNGGDVGFFSKKADLPLHQKAAFYIRKGEVSDIIKAKSHYYIIKVEDKKPAREPSFSEIKERVSRELEMEKKRGVLLSLSRKLEKKAKVTRNLGLLTFSEENIVESLQLTTIDKGMDSGYKDRANLVIKNETRWKRLWDVHSRTLLPQPPLPKFNFDREMVIAAFRGQQPTGGYEIEIESIEKSHDTLIITINATDPKPADLVSQVLTQPYHMVKIPKSSLLIKFVTKER